MRIKLSNFQAFIPVLIAGFWLSGNATAGTTAEQAGRVRAFERQWKQTLFQGGRSVHRQSPLRVEGGVPEPYREPSSVLNRPPSAMPTLKQCP
jgi:hypothetical protein